jgi:hypothetical protein
MQRALPFGINVALKSLIYEKLCLMGRYTQGSFIYAPGYLAFCWIIALILWKKRIFTKIWSETGYYQPEYACYVMVKSRKI